MFSQIIDNALDSLPTEFKEKISNVSVRFDDWPTSMQLKKAGVTHGLLLGLYEGMPKTKGAHYRLKLPDTITLFKYPLLRISRSYDEFLVNVRNTLIHEIGHHFGMDEEAVRSAEAKRFQRS